MLVFTLPSARVRIFSPRRLCSRVGRIPFKTRTRGMDSRLCGDPVYALTTTVGVNILLLVQPYAEPRPPFGLTGGVPTYTPGRKRRTQNELTRTDLTLPAQLS